MLIHNASEILSMKRGLGVLKNTSVLIDKGEIKNIGKIRARKTDRVIDAKGCVVCPGFVDSHTHLVFAGTREDEFAMRVSGIDYEKIARAGGGIAQTVRMTRRASEDVLYRSAIKRLKNLAKHGTTTVEIKSGYGLSTAEEMKTLRVIKRLKQDSELDIVATYLVHTIPAQLRRQDYIEMVINKIIPIIAEKKLAQFCDIFCDKIAFTNQESERILKTAKKYGFRLKIHADQFADIRGAYLSARLKCVSADHLEFSTGGAIKAMKKAGVVPVLLPGVTFFLQFAKKPDIKIYRKLHCHPAIASDFNPGSCMIYSMPRIISLACIVYRMPVEDALLGATKYGARALNLFDRIGSIEPGKQADFVIFNIENYKKIPYYFGEDIVKYTIKKGRIIYGKNS
jgi:imidazolonepropionase